MQIINKHSLTVLEVTSRERGEEFKGAEWVELQSYVSALRAERDELREALEAITERAEAVSDGIHVEKRSEGVSQAQHVRHMANHLAQHAKLARAILAKRTWTADEILKREG